MSMMVSFVLSFFPRDVLDEILNLIESVSEDFPSYSCTGRNLSFCFTFLCDPDLGQTTLILIMTYHLIIVYPFMKSN